MMAFAALSGVHGAENVIAYRNGGSGAYPDADPPMEWSATKNVKWRWEGPLTGTAISSAIIVGDNVITLARPITVVCLDKLNRYWQIRQPGQPHDPGC